MIKYFASTQNPVIQRISNKSLYQSKFDYFSFPAIKKFSVKQQNTSKKPEYDYNLHYTLLALITPALDVIF